MAVQEIGIWWKFLYTRSGGCFPSCFPRSRRGNLKLSASFLRNIGKELWFRFGKHRCGCFPVRENYLLIARYCWFHSGLHYTGFFKAPENVFKFVDYFTHQNLWCSVLLQPQLYTLLTIFCSFTVTLVLFFLFSTQTSSCKHTTGRYSLPQIAIVSFIQVRLQPGKHRGRHLYFSLAHHQPFQDVLMRVTAFTTQTRSQQPHVFAAWGPSKSQTNI